MSARLARRPLRVEPLHCTAPPFVQTYGPEVAEIAALAGRAPDPEQEMILDLIFAIRSDGKPAAFEVDIIGPRQNFKTVTILEAELGWLFVTEQPLIVHSAHELDTTAEAFRDLASLIENAPALSRRLAPTRGDRQGISEGNGRWAIELRSGQRVKYKARTAGGGRGLTGNRVVLDEGFALTPSHMGSLMPTLTAVWGPQVVTASSAGLARSGVLRDKRDRGRAGVSPGQVYVEFGDPAPGSGCAAPDCSHHKQAIGCALDDEDRWARIMPALGDRVGVETIRSMRDAMPPEEFAREFLVWWDEPEDAEVKETAIDAAVWSTAAGADAGALSPVAFGVTVAPDRSRTTIGVAGQRRDGRVQVEMADRRPGVDWVVDWLSAAAQSWQPCAVVLDGTALSLVPALTQVDIEVATTSSRERAQASVAFFDALAGDRLRHTGGPGLSRSALTSTKRLLADGWVWEGPDSGPLAAVTLAMHGLVMRGAPKPPPAAPLVLPNDDGSSQTADLVTAGF